MLLKSSAVDMKLGGFILASLCIGFASGTFFPRRYNSISVRDVCNHILLDGCTYRHDIWYYCKSILGYDHWPHENIDSKSYESYEKSEENFMNIFQNKKSRDSPGPSTKASTEIEIITQTTISESNYTASTDDYKETRESKKVTNSESFDENTSQESNAKDNSRMKFKNTKTTEDFLKDVSVKNKDLIGENTNFTSTNNVNTLNETLEITPDITNSTISDDEVTTDSPKETDETPNFKYLNTSPISQTADSNILESLTTHTIKSTETTTQSYSSPLKSTQQPIPFSTDYSASETNFDIEGGSTSSSSSIPTNVPSSTRLYFTENSSLENTSLHSDEPVFENMENSHITTSKTAVSVTFLVIALIVLIVLGGYFVKTRRRITSYNELLLSETSEV